MIQSLIGIPFKNKGRSVEEGFDCWGLVKHIYELENKTELPDFIYSEANNNKNSLYFMEQVLSPQWSETTAGEGAVIVFYIGGIMKHAGYMLDDTNFIHVLNGTRVVIENIKNPVWKNRIAGYWRYNGNS